MADEPKKEEKKEGKSPEEELRDKVAALEQEAKVLESEIRVSEGRLKNRNPQKLAELQKENEALRIRALNLQKCLFGMLMEASVPRTPEDSTLYHDVLKAGSIEYFKKASIDVALWKDIAS